MLSAPKLPKYEAHFLSIHTVSVRFTRNLWLEIFTNRNFYIIPIILGLQLLWKWKKEWALSLIHISEPTRPLYISYAVFCLKKMSHPSWRWGGWWWDEVCFIRFLMIRRPPRSTHCISSAASDVYKRQV